MAVVFIEPGTDATHDLSFFVTTSGTVASDSTIVKTGPRAIKLSTGAGPTQAYVSAGEVLADAGRRISVDYYFDTLPAATDSLIHVKTAGGALFILTVDLLTSGILRLNTVGATDVSGTTVLAVNTHYRITLSYTITNSTTFKFQLYLNGVAEAMTNTGTLTNTGSSSLLFAIGSNAGANHNVWFDDIYVDDVSDYSDPGDIRVTAKLPSTENVTGFDTAIGAARGTTDYNNINERPLSLTNGWQHAGTSSVEESYGVQSVSAGDMNITGARLVGRMAWIWAKVGSADTAYIIDNNAAIAKSLTATAALYTNSVTDPAYPSGPAAIGMRSTGTANDTFFYEGGVVLAYIYDPLGVEAEN